MKEREGLAPVEVPHDPDLLATVEALPPVESNADYEVVGRHLVGLKTLRKEIVAKFKDPKAKALAAHRGLVAWEKEELAPVDEKIRRADGLLGAWDRHLLEEKRKAEAKARAAEREAEEKRLAEAKALQDAGLDDAADEALERPIIAPAPAPPPEAPKVEGMSRRQRWDFDVLDPAKLSPSFVMLAVIARQRQRPDLFRSSFLGQAIRKAVEAHGENAGKVVGEGSIRVRRETTRAAR